MLRLDLEHWVNDALMALFFFVIGLEVRRELSIGELTERRRVVVPAVAALCGIAVPALLFLAVNPSGEAARGWGVVIGTDTAFLLGALAIVGPRCPTQLRVFLLTLTVFDDIVAVSIIGDRLLGVARPRRARRRGRRAARAGAGSAGAASGAPRSTSCWASCCGSRRSSPACTLRSRA